MNKILLLVVSLMLLFSCNEDSFVIDEPFISDLDNSSFLRETKVVGIGGPYDIVGFGYDATLQKDEAASSRFQVFNVDSVKKYSDDPDRFRVDYLNERKSSYEYGLDIENYIRNININASSSFSYLKLFSGSFSSVFSKNEIQNSENSFARWKELVVLKMISINFQMLSPDYLDKIVTRQFKNDIANKPASEIINNYGTHVVSGVCLGGKLELDYTSQIKSSNKGNLLALSVKAAMQSVFKANTGVNMHDSIYQKCTNSKLSFRTVGGNPKTAITGSASLNDLPEYDINSWLASLDTSNMVMTHIPDRHLIPIWEFVSDPTKKQALKNEIIRYIRESYIYPKYQLFRYYSNFLTSHSYTAIWSEYNGYGPGPSQYGSYYYEFTLGGLVSPYDDDISDKVMLKRYWSDKNECIFITTVNLGGQINDWYGARYQFINDVGYVCLKPTGDFNKPVYKYWDAYNKSHVFTTNYNDYIAQGKYNHVTLEGISFYVK